MLLEEKHHRNGDPHSNSHYRHAICAAVMFALTWLVGGHFPKL
jgi:hypothetical protein